MMCTQCVMDTTAVEITFDANRVCGFCYHFDREAKPILDRAHSGEGRKVLEQIIKRIKESGRGKPYDSVLGLSGGTDSSYLTYLAKELGLRPLVIHVDTGWNSPESESHMKTLVKRRGFDLGVVTVDWEEILALPPRDHYEFPTSEFLFKAKETMVNMLGVRRRRYGLR